MSTLLIFGLLAATAGVAAWYVFEARWDYRLFRDRPGQVARNGSAAVAKEFLATNPDTQVLDVRSKREFSGGTLPGAISVPLGDPGFVEKIGRLERNRPVLVYCAGGYRSRKAVEILLPMCFTTIQHLHRGYQSWQLANLPVAKPDVFSE